MNTEPEVCPTCAGAGAGSTSDSLGLDWGSETREDECPECEGSGVSVPAPAQPEFPTAPVEDDGYLDDIPF